MKQKYHFALIFFTICGLFISMFLAYQYSLPQPMTCIGDDVNSCEIVRNSPYSSVFGVKMPLLGILYFMALLVIQIVQLEELVAYGIVNKVLGLTIFAGALFETFMTLIQFFVIKSFCVWCTSVEVVVLILATVYYFSSCSKEVSVTQD